MNTPIVQPQQPQTPPKPIKDQWLDLCSPAQIYSILALLGLIILAYQRQYGQVIVSALFAIIVTALMGHICQRGYEWVSWVLLFFPPIMTAILTGYNICNLKK